jgi:hypothetical protein
LDDTLNQLLSEYSQSTIDEKDNLLRDISNDLCNSFDNLNLTTSSSLSSSCHLSVEEANQLIDTNFDNLILLDNSHQNMLNYKDFCGSQDWTLKGTSKKAPTPTPTGSLLNNIKTINDQTSNCNISDYRLTLSDLFDLNLVDITNGLLINPSNGSRLTIAEAIRSDLLNVDIKEIANSMQTLIEIKNKNGKSLIVPSKLTVKECIKNGLLDPHHNEITIGLPPVKLNIYEARRRNLIMKPLTLSEAFIRNMIQPNGFVKDPMTGKYYAFETLIANDLICFTNRYQMVSNKSDYYCSTSDLDDSMVSEASAMYFFDLETKHIIDPNNDDKRLLSLSEAIEVIILN